MRTIIITMLLGGMLVACNNKQTTNNDMKHDIDKIIVLSVILYIFAARKLMNEHRICTV